MIICEQKCLIGFGMKVNNMFKSTKKTQPPSEYPQSSESVATSELRINLAELLGRIRHAGFRYIITHHGREVAALISLEDLRRLRQFESGRSARKTQK